MSVIAIIAMRADEAEEAVERAATSGSSGVGGTAASRFSVNTTPNASQSQRDPPLRDEQHEEDQRAVGVPLVHRGQEAEPMSVDAASARISVRGRGSRSDQRPRPRRSSTTVTRKPTMRSVIGPTIATSSRTKPPPAAERLDEPPEVPGAAATGSWKMSLWYSAQVAEVVERPAGRDERQPQTHDDRPPARSPAGLARRSPRQPPSGAQNQAANGRRNGSACGLVMSADRQGGRGQPVAALQSRTTTAARADSR